MMNATITSPRVADLLQHLYADAAENDPRVHREADAKRESFSSELEYYHARRHAYMPVSAEFGKLLYALARGTRARTIVEFGTSFGISTIFLAAALRDNGGGKVVTTEFDEEKAARALRNLESAGLAESVEIRVGDALETLKQPLPGEIDLILLDGAKGFYLSVLKLLEPQLRSGGLVAADNTDHDGMEDFLAHVHDPANGYVSSAIQTDVSRVSGHEVAVRC